MSSTGHLPELDLLRSQVADLSCQLAERDRTLHEQSRNLACEGQDLREQSEMLHAIVGGTASDTGEHFFPALVTQLTSVLEVQYAVVGVVQGDSIKKIRTIAVSAGGALIDNFEYALTNTPCETALGQSFACFERDVRTSFPEFPRAVQLSVEGYCGVALRAKGGAVIGLLVVMDVKPLRNTDFLKSLMTVMASRAGAELQRQQAEMGLRQQLSHLAEAQALAHLGSWNWDIDSGDVQWSDEQFRIFGHEPGAVAVTYDTLLISLHPDDHDRVLAAINDALMGKTSLDTECHIVRPNGDVRFVLTRGEVRRDTTGHPLRMAGITLDISEQKQIKEALRTSEELWQLAVRGSNNGIWDWHIQAGKVFYSSRWRAMRGFADHEIGDSLDDWRSRIHPDDLDRVLRSFDAYLAKERPEFCEEYRVQKKDGSYLWILDRGVAHWNEAGRPTRMVGSEADITERKRAEEVLRQYSSQQHAIAQFGQFSLREHGLQTVMNEAVRRIAQTLETDYCKVLELRPDSATLLLKAGVGWHDGLVGQATVSAGGDSQAGYTLSVREPVIVEDLRTEQRFSGPPLLLDHGVVSGLSVIIQGEYRPWGVLGVHTTTRQTFTQDEVAFVKAMANILGSVIERNAAEEALRVSEGRLSAFMINSPSPVFCKSWDGRYLYVNPEFERLFQLPADHIIGKTDYDIFLPEQADQFAVNDRQVIHEEHAIEFEETATYYDGIHVSLVVKFPLPDADGAVNGLIGGIVTDITPRKRAEEALRSSQEKLR
ncbi:MAG: PAS domain-containing protein, partial [Nitrospirae bacterium]|nr:PAS domain-containing protein [Nitrospirota bacterium]